MSISNIFDIPQYYYFEAGNDYVGSLNGLNFKIKHSDVLTIYLYHGAKSYELSEPYAKETFSNDVQGYSELVQWLESEYLTHKQTEFYGNRIKLR
ncbi:MAG: hypothetical protein LIO71_10165 [Ruminococcus sp.]|nr:hypothetical protein [Ruminococcus sp.]